VVQQQPTQRRAAATAAFRAATARLAARDPGWRRARRAIRATAGAAISLAINAAIASAAAQQTGVALLGAVVAMISGLSVTEDDRRSAGLTFLLLPFVGSASVALGAALSMHRFVADAVFVGIVFAATSLRRRGPRWSAAGFLAFMTYFFSQFLHAVPAQVPWLALAATIGVAVAALLRLVVLPERPERTLRHLLRALEGQAATLLDAAVDVLEAPQLPQRLRRRVIAASGDLNRVALMVEQQLGVTPKDDKQPGHGADSVRDRVFMLEVAAAHTVSAVRAAVREGLPEAERTSLATEVTEVGRAIRSGRSTMTLHSYAAHIQAMTASGTADHSPAASQHPYRGALHVRRALAELAEAASSLQRGDRVAEPLGMWDNADNGDNGDDADGAARISSQPDPWLGVKQGLQATVAVALAILTGELLSPTRWYWAAIAAYIVFVGADTRGATLRRAVARTVGTLGGLVGGLVVATLIAGSKPAALVCIFLLLFAAWWLQPVSFLASSVCITIVLALLYVLLGMFSRHVLLLRVEETAIGAVLGGIAALVLVPARSSPVVRDAEADVLNRLADLLRAVRDGRGSGSALREVDSAFQNLRDVARPVAKGVPGAAAREVEQRVFALSAASYSARMLVSATLRFPDLDEDLRSRLDHLANRAAALAAEARGGTAGEAPPADPAPPAEQPGPEARSRTHATVAVERLDIALTRWSDPTRAPLPAAPDRGNSPGR
jgi:uncharacterized membrane protein YgaE (UPF0421/DUF939 family)